MLRSEFTEIYPRKFARTEFDLSKPVSPEALAKPRAKRAKTAADQFDQPSLDACRAIIQSVDAKLPRVGRREITNNEIIDQVQQLSFPDKKICRVIGCRGTERTMAPPSQMHPQEAPFRRMLLLRRNGNVQYEKNWDAWTSLSQRQLVRPSHSSRINITVLHKTNPTTNQQPAMKRFHSRSTENCPSSCPVIKLTHIPR